MEAIYESLSCPVAATEAINEPSFAHVTAYELLSCPDPAKEADFELPVPSVTTEEVMCELHDCCVAPLGAVRELLTLPVMKSETINALYVCPVLTKEPDFELSASPGSVTEMSVSPVSINESVFELSVLPASVNELSAPVAINAPSFDLSPGPLPPSVFNPELSVCPVPVLESNIERFVCPTTLNEINTELATLSVTAQRLAFAPLIPPVLSQETINSPHDSHVNSVTAIEPIYELSCPVSVSEPFVNCFVFPAMAPETVNALSVLSVSTLPKSLSMPGSSALSAPVWWSSVSLW